MTIARAHDTLVGRSFGEFVLRERIGAGGFGAVYRAMQPALEREAVVKVLHPQLHTSPAAIERFLREAKLASKLDHPYAAHIYAFGAEEDGELWIAMEYVRGTPLDQILKLQGPLALERFAPLLDRLCEVVHSAHEHGIIHRDIKPANVMVLARSGRLLPKLLDFGIAKGFAPGTTLDTRDRTRSADSAPNLTALPTAETAAIESAGTTVPDTMAPSATPSSGELTQAGAIIGSPLYMAPEQWLDAAVVDARTDLYALAVLAYESLSGTPPFVGPSVTMIAHAHATATPPPLGKRFPVALDRFFATALAKDPAERYPDALAFAAAFRQAAGIANEAMPLPALSPERRDAAITSAPQPIAEAIAALDAARNAHQARDAVIHVARTIIRYLGLVAVACRSRVSVGDEPAAATQLLRQLSRRALADIEWLELARSLTSVWTSRRDAYPLPELVDVLHGRDVAGDLAALIGLRDREPANDDALIAMLETAIARLAHALDGLAFLDDYPLVTITAPGIAERWMGVRRAHRTTVAVRARELQVGAVALLDAEGAPVLSLAPLFQIGAPTPGDVPELFLFDGRDARGARFVALPGSFEHHDDVVWDWFRAQLVESLDHTADTVDDARPPYRGLAAFSADDNAEFFGREKLVDEFANRLRVQPLLAVVGRSGAGKSSFVHAGVIPALRGWRAITMRPGTAPLAALAARLEHAELATIARTTIVDDHDALGAHLRADAARRGPIVLVVDQLEELFTLCRDAGERFAFAQAVASATRTADDPVRVIFTLRDDFLVRTEQIPALRNRIGHGLQLLTVPGRDDLMRILVEPARRAGYEFEDPALPGEMVDEVADQPGALALLSFTAAKLWELRDRHFRQLTRSAYKTLGGVGGALARHADLTLDAIPAEERALAREAFRHLVTSQHTRAVLARKDLRELLGSSAQADDVLEKLIAARLLVASDNEAGETIEIIHEALLVAWPRLVEWQREDAEGAHFREQLRAAAKQWQDRRRAKGLLWRGDALADYTRWRARHPGPLTEVEREFATASLAAEARGRRARRMLVASVIVALVAVVVGLVVFNARIAGQRAAAETAASELHANLQRQYEDQGRRLVLAGEPMQALAYLDKAHELGAGGRSHDFLVAQAVQATTGYMFTVRHGRPVRSPRFSSDGTRLVTAGLDRTARVWDATTGALLLTLPHDDIVSRASFSPDDKTVLTASFSGDVIDWDARTGAPRLRLRHGGRVRCAVFSPDGSLALATGDDGVAIVWELASGAERVRVQIAGAGLPSCAFAPDGATFAAGASDGVTRMWNARTGAVVHELRAQKAEIRTVAFSSDGARLVTASVDGTAVEWEAGTGRALHVLAHRGAVRSAEFSHDGKRVLTASDDRTAAIWSADSGAREHTLEGHTAGLTAAAFSPDGTYVVTAATDATAALWDVASGRALARWRGHEDMIFAMAFDASGGRVVTAGDDGRAIVWKVVPQVRSLPINGHVWRARFSHDGRHLVTAGTDGVARIWDVETGALLRELTGHDGGVFEASYSHDDRSIATLARDGKLRVWDARDGRMQRMIDVHAKAEDAGVEWSPDGARIAVTSIDGWLRLVDMTSAVVRFEGRVHGGLAVYTAVFAPDSERLYTVGGDLVVRTWDRDGHALASREDADEPVGVDIDASGQRLLLVETRLRANIVDAVTGRVQTQLVGGLGSVSDAHWSPDGRWAITSASDGTVRIWDADSGDQIGAFSYAEPVFSAMFAPDGKQFGVVLANGTAEIVALPDPPEPAALAQLLRCRDPFRIRGDHLEPIAGGMGSGSDCR